MQDGLGLAAEHGFFFRRTGSLEWDTRSSVEEMSWRSIVGPILQQYTESTDGSYVEKKESAFVWHYAAADPDFGSLQVTSRASCKMSTDMPNDVAMHWPASIRDVARNAVWQSKAIPQRRTRSLHDVLTPSNED